MTARVVSGAAAGLLAAACAAAPPPPNQSLAPARSLPPALEAEARANAMTVYRNPILPGFHPDPSICRVGGDYYLATSTFEYFPGVPIFHSRDLVHWRLIGHALTRPSQVPLTNAKSSEGIFAPTIRHHDGVFYLITTNVSGGGNFYVTTRDPAGEWSEPIWIRESSWGMDPSLFFDDDGKVYYTRHGGGERGGAYQAEIDPSTGVLKEAAKLVWSGTGGVWPEGPHLYKRGGFYYLMLSEGGTSYRHAVTVARSTSPFGPFEPFAHNPILSHRDRRELPIQATGHADLVQAEDGKYWMVFLGIRPPDGKHHHLGRETFLAPVTWESGGFPSVNGGRPITLEMSVAGLPPPAPWPAPPARDDFDAPKLALVWNFLRNPNAGDWSLSERPGFLRLHGSQVSLDEIGSPAFVGQRQTELRAEVATELEFRPNAVEQEAGLTLRANEANHYDLVITLGREGARVARLRSRVKGQSQVIGEAALPDGLVILRVSAHPDRYAFSVAARGSEPIALGALPTAALSSEAAGGFTGAYFGLFASRRGTGSMPPADFDWFEARPVSE